jgi:hypothetical protein
MVIRHQKALHRAPSINYQLSNYGTTFTAGSLHSPGSAAALQ